MEQGLDGDPRRAVARLAVAIMAADGRVTAPEVDALSRLDALGLGRLGELVEDELQRARRAPIDLAPACAALSAVGADGAAVLLGVLAEIAVADRMVDGRERATYDAIARLLGVPAHDADALLHAAAAETGPAGDPDAEAVGGAAARAGQAAEAPAPAGPRAIPVTDAARTGRGTSHATAADALRAGADALRERAGALLGVVPGASREDLDAAYLAVAARYDPANLTAMGAEFVALAVRKLAEATAAWEILVAAQPSTQ